MVGAAVEPRPGVVDDSVGAIDKRDVFGVVAHFFFGSPTVHIRLADPETVGGKRSRNDVVAPAHEAFAGGNIGAGIKIAGERAGCGWGKVIEGADVEASGDAAGLGRNESGVKARAVVGHGHGGVGEAWVNAIAQAEKGEAV